MRWITIILILFSALPVFALSDWVVSTEEWVSVHHHPKETANVQAILDAVYFSYPLISENLGLKFTGKLEIYLASKPAEFGELTDWKLPAWAQGVAYSGKNMVVLKSPKYSGNRVDLAKAAVHEFIHILLATDVGRVPLWLNEGLAVMLSGEGYFDDRQLTNAAITGKFVPFRKMERVLKFDPGSAHLAYQQALAATRYLVGEFGWGSVSRMLAGVKHGQAFDKAFFDATGMWPDEFEGEWIKLQGGRYKYSFLKNFDSYISYVFVPLLLLGGLAAYLRRRRILKRWKREEQYFDFGDY